MAGYVIGSDKGKDIANNMKSGSTYKASDGSTWRKNNDGSVSVTTKNGGYTSNALGGGSTGGNSNSGGGGGKSSVNKNTNVNSTPSKVTTNTSYNGNFLDVDMNSDYNALKKSAIASGDLSAAAQYEALRNAKINYLNSINQNTGGYTTTNDYIRNYTESQGKNGAGTNNQGGAVYTNTISNISDLPSNWTKADIKGSTYVKRDDGIYQITGKDSVGNDTYTLKGNGVNSNTGEFTFNNSTDAAKAAYLNYLTSGGKVGYEYAMNRGLIDSNYVNAMQNGTVYSYDEEIKNIARAKSEEEKQKLAFAVNNKYNSENIENDVNDDDENSFETDLIVPKENTVVIDKQAQLEEKRRKEQEIYRNYILSLQQRNKTHRL